MALRLDDREVSSVAEQRQGAERTHAITMDEQGEKEQTPSEMASSKDQPKPEVEGQITEPTPAEESTEIVSTAETPGCAFGVLHYTCGHRLLTRPGCRRGCGAAEICPPQLQERVVVLRYAWQCEACHTREAVQREAEREDAWDIRYRGMENDVAESRMTPAEQSERRLVAAEQEDREAAREHANRLRRAEEIRWVAKLAVDFASAAWVAHCHPSNTPQGDNARRRLRNLRSVKRWELSVRHAVSSFTDLEVAQHEQVHEQSGSRLDVAAAQRELNNAIHSPPRSPRPAKMEKLGAKRPSRSVTPQPYHREPRSATPQPCQREPLGAAWPKYNVSLADISPRPYKRLKPDVSVKRSKGNPPAVVPKWPKREPDKSVPKISGLPQVKRKLTALQWKFEAR